MKLLYGLYGLLAIGLVIGIAYIETPVHQNNVGAALRVCTGPQGCTGIGSTDASNEGKAIIVASTSPNLTYTFGTAGGSGATTTPGGSDTQVQFNDAGSFGGSDAFRFDKTGPKLFFGTENNNNLIQITNASTPDTGGGGLTIKAGEGLGAGDGGSFEFDGGNADELGAGAGGGFAIAGGAGGGTSGSGGSLSLTAGSAQGGDSDGGGVTISAGQKSGGGSYGAIVLSDPTEADIFRVQSDGVRVKSNGGDGYAIFNTPSLTADRIFSFPDASGTFALSLTGATGLFGGSILTIGTCSTTSTPVIGASTSSQVVVATPQIYPGDGTFWDAYVSAPDTVTVKVCAVATLTPTASIYNIKVIQ